MIRLRFKKSGIRTRISYYLIGLFGKSTLGLCHVMAMIDMILLPAILSNVAPSGGITYPIFNGVMEVLDNSLNRSTKDSRHILLLIQGYKSFSTSAMFITACVPKKIV